jgi:hypothetical protein
LLAKDCAALRLDDDHLLLQERVKMDKVAGYVQYWAADMVNMEVSQQQLMMTEVQQTSLQPLLCLLEIQHPDEQLMMEMMLDHPCP